MSADRELLELAAKAAGLEITRWDSYWCPIISDEKGYKCGWNPLRFDSDAFRLVVKLGIDVVVSVSRPARSAACPPNQIGTEHYVEEDHGNDAYAATRRAIVRAAAEIGRSTQAAPPAGSQSG